MNLVKISGKQKIIAFLGILVFLIFALTTYYKYQKNLYKCWQTITEGTVGSIQNVRVGVSNIWEREYTDDKGITQKGPTGLISLFEPETKTEKDIIVHKGMTIDTTLGNSRIIYKILNVMENKTGSGYIVISNQCFDK